MNQDSLIFNLGGNKGDWTADIISTYNCSIFVLESFNHKNKFFLNPKNQVFNFGLSRDTKQIPISVNEEASSIYAKVGEESQVVSLIRTTDSLKEHNISYIDLMKINIEGGEFDLLDHLIETDFVKNITDIQIQINDFFPNAESLMKKIQQTLKRTHYLTF